jgi:hypothetical protein
MMSDFTNDPYQDGTVPADADLNPEEGEVVEPAVEGSPATQGDSIAEADADEVHPGGSALP